MGDHRACSGIPCLSRRASRRMSLLSLLWGGTIGMAVIRNNRTMVNKREQHQFVWRPAPHFTQVSPGFPPRPHTPSRARGPAFSGWRRRLRCPFPPCVGTRQLPYCSYSSAQTCYSIGPWTLWWGASGGSIPSLTRHLPCLPCPPPWAGGFMQISQGFHPPFSLLTRISTKLTSHASGVPPGQLETMEPT